MDRAGFVSCVRADTSTAVPFNQRILVSRYLTRQLTVLSCPSPSRLVVDLQNKSPDRQNDGSISAGRYLLPMMGELKGH